MDGNVQQGATLSALVNQLPCLLLRYFATAHRVGTIKNS